MAMALPQIFIEFLLIFLLIYLPFCQAQLTKIPHPYEYSVDKFNATLVGNSLELLGAASLGQRALRITPDSRNTDIDYSLYNSSGRVMLKKRFKVWAGQKSSVNSTNSSSDIVASFNSTFLVSFNVPKNESPGEGFAFVISKDLDIPYNSYGEWLGLTNATLNGNSSNHFVAVEFDTKKQSYDINDNHIGLNINGVQSKKNISLSYFNITLAPLNQIAIKYWVWIEYNGTTKLLEVYMDEENKQKPARPVLSENINLKDYVDQHSHFGFTASTGTNAAQLNCLSKWYLTVQILDKDKDIWLKIGIALGAAVVFLLVICVLVWFYYRKNKKVCDELNILNELLKLPGTPKEFQYKDLKEATNNFSEKMKLGQGGFGVVYKGVLPKENTQVAVKRFSREWMKGIADFLAELKIIYRLRHKHLVCLLGWCRKDRTLLLVYEYMPNGSLDTHLLGSPDKFLSWAHRNNIISGLASALHYLHNEFDQMVVHRDLKSSNILLDSEYNARLGDFGLARALEQGKKSYATADGVPGTLGYIAPETFHSGKATRDSDVFGFGAVVLEVVCGERPWTKVLGSMIVVDWVWKLYRENRILEAVDEKLGTDYVDVEAERLLLLGLACCHPIASERPKAQNIVQIISGSVPVPEVPHFKPTFVWDPEDSTTRDTESESTNTTNSTVCNLADMMHTTLSYKGESVPQCLSREKYVGVVDIVIKP